MSNPSHFAPRTWEGDCLRHWGKVLEGQYAHWCYEWDDMPIDETCPEFDSCLCYKTNSKDAP